MSKDPIRIHPLDFAEVLNAVPLYKMLFKRDDGSYIIDDQVYIQDLSVPQKSTRIV